MGSLFSYKIVMKVEELEADDRKRRGWERRELFLNGSVSPEQGKVRAQFLVVQTAFCGLGNGGYMGKLFPPKEGLGFEDWKRKGEVETERVGRIIFFF